MWHLSSIQYGMTLGHAALNMEICLQFIVISDKATIGKTGLPNNSHDWRQGGKMLLPPHWAQERYCLWDPWEILICTPLPIPCVFSFSFPQGECSHHSLQNSARHVLLQRSLPWLTPSSPDHSLVLPTFSLHTQEREGRKKEMILLKYRNFKKRH